MELVRDALGAPPFDPGRVSDDALLDRLIDQVRDLNSGDLTTTSRSSPSAAHDRAATGGAAPGVVAAGRSAGSSAAPSCS